MIPTPTLVSAVIALPLEARRLLAQRPGPGWWCDDRGNRMCFARSDRLYASDGNPSAMFDRGWAWLPADAAEWMEAATPETGFWEGHSDEGGGVWRIFENHKDGREWMEWGAPSCALAALRARFPQEVTP